MDIRQLFDVEAIVPFDVESHTLNFHFRNASTEEEIEFRRQTSKQRVRENGTLESTDVALKAPLRFFSKLCTKITMKNGTSEAQEISAEEQKFIPDYIKLEALAAFRGRIKRRDEDLLLD